MWNVCTAWTHDRMSKVMFQCCNLVYSHYVWRYSNVSSFCEWTYVVFLFLMVCHRYHNSYRQPNKIMVYLTFHKWLVSVCNIHNDIMNGTNQNQSFGKSELRYYFIRLTIYKKYVFEYSDYCFLISISLIFDLNLFSNLVYPVVLLF